MSEILVALFVMALIYIVYLLFSTRDAPIVIDIDRSKQHVTDLTLQRITEWPSHMSDRQWRPYDAKHKITFIVESINVVEVSKV